MKKLVSLLLAMLLVCSCACAEVDLTSWSITSAHVAAVNFVDVTAPYSGTLESFDLSAGDAVTADQPLFTLLTTQIRAQEDSTVTGLFVESGSDATAAVKVYGALGALDPDRSLRIKCTTTGAYNDDENKELQVGETLYFKSTKSGNEEGTGRVVAVTGDSYVVEILTGNFDLKDTLTMYRNDGYSNNKNVGKGVVYRRDPVTFTGSGIVDQVNVAEGDSVKTGDVLMTLMGADADPGASPTVVSPDSGVVANVAVSAGQQVWKGEVLCRIYLTDKLEMVANVDEVDLHGLKVGDRVYATLDTDKNSILNGTVTEISGLGVTSANAALYTVHVSLDGTSSLMLGQSGDLYLPAE